MAECLPRDTPLSIREIAERRRAKMGWTEEK
jgi:hypothetical protein